MFALASVRSSPPPPPGDVVDTREVWLETLDGRMVIPVARWQHPGPIRLLRGALGLEMPPVDMSYSATPGADGGRVDYMSTPRRPVTLPLYIRSRTQAEQWALVESLRDVTNPARTGADGGFRIVCSSASGVRQLQLAYTGGLEGDEMSITTAYLAAVSAVAVQPYAEDRDETSVPFFLEPFDSPFLSAAPGTEYPWGTRQLAPSAVTTDGYLIQMTSSVPVYPTIELTGPADSVLITTDTGLLIDVPGGVESGETLRIVTSQRGKSIRAISGGVETLAAGRVSRGSRLRALPLGDSRISVTAPGASPTTRLRLSWRGQHRGLW